LIGRRSTLAHHALKAMTLGCFEDLVIGSPEEPLIEAAGALLAVAV